MAEKLTPEQRMAVTNRGGKLLVSAAAGSGKTKVLVDRLLSYLEDPKDPANLDDFLIITYTKAAAAELRGKIAAKLTERIAEKPESRHLQQQMQRLYLAKISTVHSFCSDILREYAYRLDLSADFRVADENECQELQYHVMERLLDAAYETAGEDQDFCAFVDSQGLGRDDRLIPEIILKVYNSARCHLDPDGWLEWCIQASNVEDTGDAAQTVWGTYLLSDLKNYLMMQIDALKKCIHLASQSEGMEKPTALLEATTSQLEYLYDANTWDEVVARKGIDYGRLLFSKKCTDVELAERIKAIRNACKKGLDKKLRSFADPSLQVLRDLGESCGAARGLIKLVRQFGVEYDKRKKARRVLDFGDLEHKMLDLLLGKKRYAPTVLSDEIGSRFREIMVDEYQDSNAVQDAIFSALTQKRQNCFMVGDVKQSIYQFRLADPGIFIEKYNAYLDAESAENGLGRKVLLSQNFRSSGGVISAVNDVFSACMTPKVGGLVYGEEEQLREGIPHIDLPEPEVELYGVSVREDTYAEEAAFTADRICQLLDGKHMVRDGERLRPIIPDDIVILLRSPGSVGGEFSYALEQRGIRCTTGGSIDLLQTEEIRVLKSLLQIISNPLQDIPLIAVLSSRVFGFTADDLAVIRSRKRYGSLYSALQDSPLEKVHTFLSVLGALRKDARLCTLSQLLQKIFIRTRFDSIYACLADGKERTENLQYFSQIASNYESLGPKDLGQFLDHLEAMEKKGLTVSSDHKPGGAVTIMSIHKSKGLEFPVVFLCGLSRSFNQESVRAQVLCDRELGLGLSCVDAKRRVRYPTISKRAIASKIMTDSISEEMRVLYVAMTRPKDRLIMTYAVKNLENDLSDIARRMDISSKLLMTREVSCPGEWVLQTALRRTEAGALFALGGRPDCASVREPVWRISVAEAEPSVSSSVMTSIQTLPLSADMITDLKESLAFCYAHAAATQAPSKQTATQLKGRFKDQEAAENAQEARPFYRSFRKPGFSPDTAQGKEHGSAVHTALQYIRFNACKDISGVQEELQRLVTDRFLSLEQAKMVDAQMLMQLFSTELGEKLRTSENVLREFKFSILDDGERYYPDMKGEQILLQGVVDCALVEQDGITVIDFKTDRVTEETLQRVASQYRSQVQVYADALRRIYRKKIKAALLYFFQIGRFVEVNL